MRIRPMKLNWLIICLGLLPIFHSSEARSDSFWPQKIKVGGEFRARIESEINFPSKTSTPINDTFGLLRTRVYLDINPNSELRIFGMFQSTESIDQDSALIKYPDQQSFYQGWFFAKNNAPTSTAIKVGRQELIYGDQRLIGNADWTNIGRSFDGAVLHIDNKAFWVDAFGTRIKTPAGLEQQFAGVYGHWKKFPGGEYEPYVLVLHGSNSGVNSGELTAVTIGSRIKAKFKKNWDWGFEGAYQSGESAGNLVSAFATHARLGFTFPIPWRPRLGIEFNFASGDNNPTSGTVSTFNNLFPTNHDKYGFMDLFAWKNLYDLRTGLNCQPLPFMTATLEYHLFMLPAPANGTFLYNGTQLRAGIPGASPFAGQEIDALLKFKPWKYFDALIGYSVFFPGTFYSDTGESATAQFVYSQLTARY